MDGHGQGCACRVVGVVVRSATVAVWVGAWSGREIRVLRAARRMSVREFADHLGVSHRMVSMWESGGSRLRPRPVNQSALDVSLARASRPEQERFTAAVAAPDAAVGVSTTGSGVVSVAAGMIRHPVDGRLMSWVPAGVSPVGPDRVPTMVAGFFLDVYPTTNADYARFVAATGYPPPPSWVDGAPPPGLADHPVVGVRWVDAAAYAAYTGSALPSGVQVEKAARGPAGLTYPWGDAMSVLRANVRESGWKTTTPVGWFDTGVSPYGVFDLCGNVWEWCATPTDDGYQVRGGAFTTPATAATVTDWQSRPAQAAFDDVGFRCVIAASALLDPLIG